MLFRPRELAPGSSRGKKCFDRLLKAPPLNVQIEILSPRETPGSTSRMSSVSESRVTVSVTGQCCQWCQMVDIHMYKLFVSVGIHRIRTLPEILLHMRMMISGMEVVCASLLLHLASVFWLKPEIVLLVGF